jgi:hypothetical protein
MTIVSNTSPLCYLALIGHAEILAELYGKVHITQKVYRTGPFTIDPSRKIRSGDNRIGLLGNPPETPANFSHARPWSLLGSEANGDRFAMTRYWEA